MIVTGSESGLGERQVPDVTFATIVDPEVRLSPVTVHVPPACTVVVPSRAPDELFEYTLIVVPVASEEKPLTEVTGDVAAQPEKLIAGFNAWRETVIPAVAGEKHNPVETCFTVITLQGIKEDTLAVQAKGEVPAEVAEAI